ncbi:hypothetical protein ACQQ2Q_02995 [Agrobacterium sp. ES01]|uniref:hypothetical protein n=1 Tax=Agrobacterium sp. ES01 TaxID=3420714 RepID=UPI003D14D9AE
MGPLQKTVIEGQSYVLVPEEEYEDLLDTLAAHRTMARVEAGEETWPAELV